MFSEAPTEWSRLAMADVVVPTHRPVDVRPDEEYPLLGVRWYCDGPRHHGTHAGKTLKTSTLHRVEQGEITYNKMWVKKAAFAVLGEEQHGLYATSEYPTFAPDPKRLDLAFFGTLVQTKGFQDLAAASCKGSTSRARLNPKDFLRLPVVLPPLPEQKKIAEILGSVDEAVKATEAVIEQTRRVKEGLLQELLTKGIGHTRFKQTEIGEIPEGWETVRLEEMGLDPKEVLKTGPFGSSLKGEHFTESGYPVLNIQCLGEGELQGGHFFVDAMTAEKLSGYRVDVGDIVFSRVADVGRSVVIPEAAAGWIISSNLMRIRLDKARFVPEFVTYQITHGPAVAQQLGGSVNDAGREIVNGKTMRKLIFPAPPPDEQRRLVDVAASLDDEMRRHVEEKRGLVRVKAGLLQDLLTGKVRVKL